VKPLEEQSQYHCVRFVAFHMCHGQVYSVPQIAILAPCHTSTSVGILVKLGLLVVTGHSGPPSGHATDLVLRDDWRLPESYTQVMLASARETLMQRLLEAIRKYWRRHGQEYRAKRSRITVARKSKKIRKPQVKSWKSLTQAERVERATQAYVYLVFERDEAYEFGFLTQCVVEILFEMKGWLSHVLIARKAYHRYLERRPRGSKREGLQVSESTVNDICFLLRLSTGGQYLDFDVRERGRYFYSRLPTLSSKELAFEKIRWYRAERRLKNKDGTPVPGTLAKIRARLQENKR